MAILLLGYEVWMTALGVVAFTTEGWSVAAWAAIGLTAAAAVVVGAVRNAPRRRVPWFFFAAALVASIAGDTALGLNAARPGWLSIVAGACYVMVVPLTLASLTMLTQTSVVLGDRSRLLDTLAVTCGAMIAIWVFLIGPSLKAADLGFGDRALLAMCVIGDLLFTLVMLRLVVADRQTWSVVLLAIGSTGALAGDVMYGALQVYGAWHPGGISEACYLVFYACVGAAALHPSMVRLTEPVDLRPAELGRTRTTLLRVSLAVPPVALLVQVVTGEIHDLVVIAVGTIFMGQVVIVRLSDTVEKHRRSAARERVLRDACGELVSTVDVEQAVAVVRGAVGRLMPQETAHTIVISVGCCVELTGVSPDDAAADETRPTVDSMPARGRDRRSRLTPTESLRPALRNELEQHRATLVYPLTPGRCAWGEAGAGLLCVAADRRVLEAMRDAVEVLAAQLALTLERIALSDVINRRDGDRYLRTVVQNTSDVVLILDDDYLIRYASPSLALVLGLEAAACATLLDLLHPEDHAQIAEMRIMAERSGDLRGARGMWNLRKKDGSHVLVEIDFRDLRKDRMVRGFVITMHDVSERREREQELIRRALEGTGGWKNRESSLSRFR